MKSPLRLAACFLTTSLALVAGEVKLPKGFFPITDYAAARKTAAEEGKPVAVIMTKLDTDCPICEATSNEMIKSVRSKVVWVLFPPGSDYKLLPAKVNAEFRTVSVYPYLAVLDPEGGDVLAFTHQKEYSADDRESLKKVKDAVRDFAKKKS